MIALLLGVTPGIFAVDNCYTPEATAKLTAAAALVDIVGIKLGMPALQAAG
jgi:hypothetical protein